MAAKAIVLSNATGSGQTEVLSALTTTHKTSLVAAINEIKATTSTGTGEASTADAVTETTDRKFLTAAQQTYLINQMAVNNPSGT